MSSVPTRAQLTKEWSYDISTLGRYAYIDHPVIVDDSGNAFVLSYAGIAFEGARVTKIKPDSTIEWQVSYPDSGLYLNYFGRSPAGDLYVFGHHEIFGGYDVSAVGIKINGNGTLAWGRILTAQLAPYASYPRGAVDIDGNLWIGFTETPVDSFCIDSLPDGFGNPGESGEKSHAVLYRIDSQTGTPTLVERVTGEDRQLVGVWNIRSDNEGFVDVGIYVGEFCCNSLCQNCRDSCFTYFLFGKAGFRGTYYLRRYTTAGGFSGPTWMAATDNPIYSPYIFTGRNGELLIFKHEYMSPQPYWSHVEHFGHWATSFSGETQVSGLYAPTTDYSGNVLFWHWLVSTKAAHDDSERETMVLDAATGSVKWTKPGIAGYMGADRDGNIYVNDRVAVHKFDHWGSEQWVCSTGVDLGFIRHADTSGWFYFQNYITLARYKSTKHLTVRDSWGDSLANKEFEMIHVADDSPLFTEDTLGRVTTDDMGRLEMTFHTADSFIVSHDAGKDTLAIGDAIKISRVLDDSLAVKHMGTLGTMYSIHLDNMVVDSFSTIFFDTLTDESEQDIYLTHTEVRYNLLVSIDWDATQEYLQGLQESFRRMANYLYDVTDGQVRIDTVMIYDDRYLWDQADIWVYAKNTVHPCAGVMGIYNPVVADATVELPRKWFGDEDESRNQSYDEHPLKMDSSIVYRTTAHELGHYTLGFYDEYQFDAGGVRCPTILNYGFMDFQYESGGSRASEMSGSAQYTDAACRNTDQYVKNSLRSCWGQFEARFERRYGADDILASIIKPDDDERELLAGYDYLFGPNNDVDDPLFLDYDIGAQVVFPVPAEVPAAGVKTLNLLVRDAISGIPLANAEIALRKTLMGATVRDIQQGATSDAGKIYVLGAEVGDLIMVAGRVDTLGTEKSGSAVSKQVWAYGEATVGGSGLSKLGNSYSMLLQDDSVTIDAKPVYGDYPLIFQPDISADSIQFAAGVLNTFSTTPEIEIRPEGLTSVTYALTLSGSEYTVSLSDNPDISGSFLLWADDDSSNSFFATADYIISGNDHHVIGPYGGTEVYLDSTAGSVDRFMVTSSSYPPFRTGLDDNAIQAGRIHALSCYPSEIVSSGADLIIRYSDGDLDAYIGLHGEESSLRIFRWDNGSWSLVGGQPDTAQNTVYGTITETGVYAAFTTEVVTDVEDEEQGEILPYRFELSQNYPNPFNPVTNIEYSIMSRSQVRIEVFNILGKKVATLVDETKPAGTYNITWDGRGLEGGPVASGIYLYRFTAGEYMETKKMMLVK